MACLSTRYADCILHDMMQDIRQITRALAFAADAHRNHRRKGTAQEPYINHLIEVLDLVAQAAGGFDVDLLVASILHDAIEDTHVSAADLRSLFGEKVASVVAENSDDMTLPKEQRRRDRIAAMATKSQAARIVKTADVISNLRALANSPPAGWGADRKLGYVDACRLLINAARGSNAELEAIFDNTADYVERAIREEAGSGFDGRIVAVRELEKTVGQPTYLIYLLNTQCRDFTNDDIREFCNILGGIFSSAIVQQADAIFEGRRRSALMARIRTDSAEAVVAIAQRICIAFRQQFVGIEVEGRYIRIYADDTD